MICPLSLKKKKDRKSTRLNSSHLGISYAVFCLKKKKTRLNSSHLGISYAVFCFKKYETALPRRRSTIDGKATQSTVKPISTELMFNSCEHRKYTAHAMSMTCIDKDHCHCSVSILSLSRFNVPRVSLFSIFSFFFNDTATTEIYTLSLHDALPFFLKEPPPAHHSLIPLVCPLLL